MMRLEIDSGQMERLTKAVLDAGKSIENEIAGALNDVAKKTRLDMGRRIKEEITLKKNLVEAPIKITAQATATSLHAVIQLKKEARLGLQYFGAKQNKTGVRYKISKRGGSKTIPGAFMGPKPGALALKLYGGVWIRRGEKRAMTKGRRQKKVAQPIVKLYGVSPWGAYVKNNMEAIEVEAVSKEIYKQMERRINLNVLRANGLVST